MRFPLRVRRSSAALAISVVVGSGAFWSCGSPASRASSARAAPLPALSDSSFGALVARISEPGGFFDTDNLVSNERAYLKVTDALDRLGLQGGAYIGVGPDQNFSYIARLRPRIAFIVDIRRDNLLDHLFLKSLFHRSPTRVEYMAALFGRRPPADPMAWRNEDVDALLAWVDSTPVDSAVVAQLDAGIARDVASHDVPLNDSDLTTIRRFHQAFIDNGPGLRFHSYGRRAWFYYPTWEDLARETDLEGKEASFLASEPSYAFVRGMEEANLIVPVVGDLSGPHAVREIGAVLGELGLELTAFYASNVEYYLWREGRFDLWAQNLASLPAAPEAVVIRSYFRSRGRVHPSIVAGYQNAQTLQPVSRLLEAQGSGGFASYFDLVTRDALPLSVGGGR